MRLIIQGQASQSENLVQCDGSESSIGWVILWLTRSHSTNSDGNSVNSERQVQSVQSPRQASKKRGRSGLPTRAVLMRRTLGGSWRSSSECKQSCEKCATCSTPESRGARHDKLSA